MSCCPSDLRLERYLAGSGSPDVVAHVASCAGCQSTIAEMHHAGDVFRREVYPATRERVVEPGSPWRAWVRWLLCAVPVPAAAVAALAFLVTAPSRPPASYVGAKGALLGMTVYTATLDGARSLADGSSVPASASLRFQVSVAQPCRLWVVSVDERAAVSRLYPPSGEGGAEVHAAGALPGGAVLDGQSGPERIYGVCAREPLAFAEVERAVRASATGGAEAVRGARSLSGIPHGALQATLLLEKVR
jgi:hypothetical protein